MTIGNFDGVHLGHQHIVRRAGEIAQEHDVVVKVVTFDPHPATVLRPGSAPPRLTVLDEKIRLLKESGADDVVVLSPTAEQLAMSPQAFVEMLVRDHSPQVFVEGEDFRYGKDRAGDLKSLRAQGETCGFAVDTVEAVEIALSDHLIASVRSSLIRWLISHGRVADASICMGRLFSLVGPVVQGEQRGRTIGVPTANVGICDELHVPGNGVYAGIALTPEGNEHAAAISVGIKPTFKSNDNQIASKSAVASATNQRPNCMEQSAQAIEAHLLDFDDDLYGQSLTLRFVRWIRDQQKFPEIDALQAQLARDVAQVRALSQDPNFATPAVAPQPIARFE